MAIPQRARERISRPHDARAVRSRKMLHDAFLALLKTRPLDEILLKDITVEAGLSYPVFFRHFASKEDVLADIAKEEVRSVLTRAESAMLTGGDAGLIELCRHVDERRALWSSLLTGGANKQMREEFSIIAEEIAARRGRTNPYIPFDLITQIVVNAIFETLTWWLRQPADYPTTNIVTLLRELVVKPYTNPIAIDLETP